ncbi:MAG TPA: hypothetical protein DIC23_13350 [Planctomycetaceae bacterium]|nr:hypothetical protein [Planctomycetaceae bacterium]
MTGCGPGLLVSVRSLAEARAAIGGGCAVLDLKEPSRGPLGMADPEVVGEAAGWGRSRGVATSMAMGEVADWSDEAVAEFTLPAVDFAKLGLAQLAGDGRDDGWVTRWKTVRDRLGGECRWIAVAYADARVCGAPGLEAVMAAAIETDCAGVLIDTWDKSGGSLTHHLSQKQLEEVRGTTRDAGLLLALAGRVSIEDLDEVSAVEPDLVAVRSAACQDGRRDLPVEERRVRELVARLGGTIGSVESWRNAG